MLTQRKTQTYLARFIIRRIRSFCLILAPVIFLEVLKDVCGMQKGPTAAVYKQVLHMYWFFGLHARMAHVMVQVAGHPKLAPSLEILAY